MTNEEAIELIDCALGNGCSKLCNYKNRGQCFDTDVIDAKEIAVEALRKQVPMKPVLDATCGSRMIWFNKADDRCLFVDKRKLKDEAIWKSGNGKSVRYLNIDPDVVCDFTQMPFNDDTFYHVVFDPPHLNQIGDSAWMAKKYGKLPKNGWEQVIHDGFWECMRVLKQNGTLIFKWNEYQIPVNDVIKAIGCFPLYGTRSGKQHKTIWMAFIKDGK